MNPLLLTPVAALIITIPALGAQTIYTQGKLPNGLRYHILQTPNAGKRLELRLQVNAGTNDENEEEKGGAHMLEHMAFRSSPQFPLGIADTLSRQGWQMGRHYNAQTAHEYTRYKLTPPKGRNQLDDALIIMKQFIQERDFKAEDWQQEQKIIQGENRTLLNLKERMAQQRTASFKNGSREARYRPIGDEAAIDNMQVGTLSAFHKKWYAPNNAILVVISSLPAKSIQTALEKHFNNLPARTLPTRIAEEYEPKLHQGWHVDQLQDKDNTESELNLIFRFPNEATRTNTQQGEYERLLDNFAAYIINLRLQKHNLPPEVQQINLRNGNLGNHTGFIGWLTQTTPDGHETALRTLLNLRKKILSEPASDDEIAAYRRRFSELLRLSQQQTSLSDDPDQLLSQIQDTLFSGKPLRTPAEHASAVRPALYKISSRDVNDRIHQWLTADDKLIQAQAPGMNPVNLPDVGQLNLLAENPDALLRPPANKHGKSTASITNQHDTTAAHTLFAPPAVPGKIAGGQYDAVAKTEIMQLSNGDTAVVLQTPTARNKTYLKIITQTGYLQSNTLPWQAHLAGDIIWKTPPAGLSETQFSSWKARRQIQLSHKITPYHQIFEGNAPDTSFENLLQLYRAYQNPNQTDNRWQSLLKIEAARRPVFHASAPGKQEAAEFNLHYGNSEYEEPSSNSEIASLSNTALLHQWRLLNQTPAAYYIVTSQTPQSLKPIILQYLATIPRTTAGNGYLQPLSGSTVQRIPIIGDKHTDVSAWSWQPFYNWTPETSEQIPLLVNLANARLKSELRGRLQGTYSLKFTAQPDPEHNLVEDQLYFRAEPQRAQELWQAAEHILQSLPENISRSEAENLKRLFIEQEEYRQQNPEVWLERLALSHQKYGDTRYIRELPQLKYSIIQTRLRQTAKLLWSEPNARILLTDPQP